MWILLVQGCPEGRGILPHPAIVTQLKLQDSEYVSPTKIPNLVGAVVQTPGTRE